MSQSVCVILSSAFPDGYTGTGYAARSILPVLSECFDRIDYVAVPAVAVRTPEADPEGKVVFHRVDADVSPKWLRFVRSLFSRWPGAAQRYVNAALPQVLRKLCAPPDAGRVVVIVLDAPLYWPFLADAALRASPGKVVLWCQNVIADAFTGLLDGLGPLTKRLWKWEIARLDRFERAALRDADAAWAITGDDEAEFRRRYGYRCDGIVGIRVGAERFASPIEGDPMTLLYLGSFDIRKRQGIEKFVRVVFPELRKKFPGLRLVLGGNGSETFDAPHEGIAGLGFVEDEVAFMRKGLVVVNPQEAGSGIKLKSIHALAGGKALLTTPVGAQGIPGQPGRDYLLASRVEEMGEVLAPLLESPESLAEMARSGRASAEAVSSGKAYDAAFRRVLGGAMGNLPC